MILCAPCIQYVHGANDSRKDIKTKVKADNASKESYE